MSHQDAPPLGSWTPPGSDEPDGTPAVEPPRWDAPPGQFAPPPGQFAPHPGQFAPVTPPTAPPGTNGLAVTSLVLGIIGCLLVTPLLAIILGLIALRQIAGSGGRQRGRGMAIAGVSLGALWLAFLVAAVPLGLVSGSFVLSSGVDEADLPSREEFVERLVGVGDAERALGIDQMPDAMAAEARSVVEDASGCVYDALSDEPRYLMAVYDDPAPDAGYVRVPGVPQSRIDDVDAEVQACWAAMDDRMAQLFGG